MRTPEDARLSSPSPASTLPASTVPATAPGPLTAAPAQRFEGGEAIGREEWLATEEPLELRLALAEEEGDLEVDVTPEKSGGLTLSVLMRTPGADRELLTGWLVSEGLYDPGLDLWPDPENPNLWHLRAPDPAPLAAAARLGVSSSACGVCGSGSIERLAVKAAPPVWTGGPLSAEGLSRLPERLRAEQPGFDRSGGLHAAALFSAGGELLRAFEDVGRHNAVDKVVGWLTLSGPPAGSLILCVSSRAGFEIVQKAVMAGVAVTVTVGAATSLACDTARVFGVTLGAFAREGRVTLYSGAERVQPG